MVNKEKMSKEGVLELAFVASFYPGGREGSQGFVKCSNEKDAGLGCTLLRPSRKWDWLFSGRAIEAGLDIGAYEFTSKVEGEAVGEAGRG